MTYIENNKRKYDVLVIGGGSGGVGAALSAARHGAKTALIQERPVLGGNNSSEIRMHISGADAHALRKNARETGIVETIALMNRHYNPQNSFSVSDTIYWELATFQKNLDLYLNTRITGITMVDNEIIRSANAIQLSTEKEFEFIADIFIDCTGDGFIGALSGAEFMSGREAKDDFGEPHAEDVADGYTMGNSLMFTTVDMGKPVRFIKPEWAYTYSEDDLVFRRHLDGEANWRAKAGIQSGFWWIELGGLNEDIIKDGEVIRDNLLKALYGVWDHIKNGGQHGADHLMLDWVGFVPGKRESRRLTGDYILKENDLMETSDFSDAVAYGGWTLDRHNLGGIANLQDPPADLLTPPDLYQIPYRCYYSRNINNLMMAGRNISCTHMAMSSTRVMGTCMVGGQAAGIAAAIAAQNGITPGEVGRLHIRDLQQKLLNADCYIPNVKNDDPKDYARFAIVTASSEQPGFEANKIINGFHRNVHDQSNQWCSQPMGDAAEWIKLDFQKKIEINDVILRFDSDLSQEIFVSINKMQLLDQTPGVPSSLVKNYQIDFSLSGRVVKSLEVKDNYLRHRIHHLDHSVYCDELKLMVYATNGDPCVRLFEIRAYA